MEDELLCISPIDGRYKNNTSEVRKYFSEYNLIKNRVRVEIEWLKVLSKLKEINVNIEDEEFDKLDTIINEFDLASAKRVKEIENTTKHDVKAVEYYIDEKLDSLSLSKLRPYVHFACTSEDINNIAYGIMETELVQNVLIPNIGDLQNLLNRMATAYASVAMLSHTHGQNATPTTVGKEFAIFAYRMRRVYNKIKNEKLTGKFNGTVGNFNAHVVSYPEIMWIDLSKKFVESFGLEYNLYTTQIESHDSIAMVLSMIKVFNNIILDLDSDMWMYISRNYFKQKNVEGEVGSSVMPHKINPINFENAMANAKMSNAVIDAFLNNIQISRMQRDLSDSSLHRNIGMVFAYSLIAVKQTITGLNRLSVNEDVMKVELNNTPEVLAEAIQTILRKNGYVDAYEKLKSLTRGKDIKIENIKSFIEEIEIDPNDKKMLLNLTPEKYIGFATELANNIDEWGQN